jgi:hypothetical protein
MWIEILWKRTWIKLLKLTLSFYNKPQSKYVSHVSNVKNPSPFKTLGPCTKWVLWLWIYPYGKRCKLATSLFLMWNLKVNKWKYKVKIWRPNEKQSWKCGIHIIQKLIKIMASRIIKFDTKHCLHLVFVGSSREAKYC